MAPPVPASTMTPERRAQLEAVLAREQEKAKLQNKARGRPPPPTRPVLPRSPPAQVKLSDLHAHTAGKSAGGAPPKEAAGPAQAGGQPQADRPQPPSGGDEHSGAASVDGMSVLLARRSHPRADSEWAALALLEKAHAAEDAARKRAEEAQARLLERDMLESQLRAQAEAKAAKLAAKRAEGSRLEAEAAAYAESGAHCAVAWFRVAVVSLAPQSGRRRRRGGRRRAPCCRNAKRSRGRRSRRAATPRCCDARRRQRCWPT